MHAVRRHAVEDVRVQIDEPGRDGLAGHVDDSPSLRRRNVRGDLGDLPVLHRDVEHAAQVLRRIDDRATLQEQVVHGRASSTSASTRCPREYTPRLDSFKRARRAQNLKESPPTT